MRVRIVLIAGTAAFVGLKVWQLLQRRNLVNSLTVEYPDLTGSDETFFVALFCRENLLNKVVDAIKVRKELGVQVIPYIKRVFLARTDQEFWITFYEQVKDLIPVLLVEAFEVEGRKVLQPCN